jgi:hypothetical protein
MRCDLDVNEGDEKDCTKQKSRLDNYERKQRCLGIGIVLVVSVGHGREV